MFPYDGRFRVQGMDQIQAQFIVSLIETGACDNPDDECGRGSFHELIRLDGVEVGVKYGRYVEQRDDAPALQCDVVALSTVQVDRPECAAARAWRV